MNFNIHKYRYKYKFEDEYKEINNSNNIDGNQKIKMKSLFGLFVYCIYR